MKACTLAGEEEGSVCPHATDVIRGFPRGYFQAENDGSQGLSAHFTIQAGQKPLSAGLSLKVTPMTDNPVMIPTLAATLARKGYDQLTPVQEAVTKAALSENDLLVSAQTGSGKTVGFGLAIAPTILDAGGRFGPAGTPLALVIAPTRELALQVKRELGWLYEDAGAQIASCVGGMDMRDERRALDRGAHIVVGTPGRLRDHLQRGSLDLSLLHAAVLDEADEMLDLGFREDLEFILAAAPESRRTLMFSATVPKAIEKLAQEYQKEAVRVSVAAAGGQHADITYQAMVVSPADSENAIVNVLRFHEAQNAIIFCKTRAEVNRLTTRLANRSFSVVALSGELSQAERTHALQAMRDGRARVCVATDVAARGIDLPNLELVIHADLPTNADTLLHRSGRTGRAGRKGISCLVVPRNGRRRAETLLRFAKVNADWVDAPSADAVRTRDEERLLADPSWSEAVGERDAEIAARLLAQHGAKRIAAAYVHLYMGARSAPEELAAPGTAGREERTFGPSRWFSISVGRRDNAEPRWVLPMLCRAGNISRTDVGAIRIQETETFVEVLEEKAQAFLKALGPGRALENGATLKPLSSPPFGERPARSEPSDRPARTERTERPDRAERPARVERTERLPHTEQDERPPRAERPARPERAEKPYSARPAAAPYEKKPHRKGPSAPRAEQEVFIENGLLIEPAAPKPKKHGGGPGKTGKSAKYGKPRGAEGAPAGKGWASKKPKPGKPKAPKR